MVSANTHTTDNGRRGWYGVAHVRALCANAGVGFSETGADQDVDAIDASLKFGRASLEVQIKCSSQWTVGLKDATLPLEESWVEKWSESKVPIYVILVKVAKDVRRWANHPTTGTNYRAIAFGQRFYVSKHVDRMVFTRDHRLTAASLYPLRDELYDFLDGKTGAAV